MCLGGVQKFMGKSSAKKLTLGEKRKPEEI